MRINVKKYLFWGLSSQKAAFFAEAQNHAIVDFIGVEKQSAAISSKGVQQLLHALKVVRGFPAVDQECLPEEELSAAVERISRDKAQLDTLLEEERLLQLEISRVAPFGEYSKADLEWIEHYGKRQIQFYYAKQGFAETLGVPENILHIATEHGFDYFLAVNPKSMQHEGMIEIIPEGSLDTLLSKHARLLKEINALENALAKEARFHNALHSALNQRLNRDQLAAAEASAASEVEEKLFTVEGWVAEDKIPLLEKIAKAAHIQYDEIAIESTDLIPTHLENSGIARIGEDLVHIYDTPSVNDKDPSLWVLFSFALFFSMIIGDAGYGLVLLLVALYLRMKTLAPSEQGKRIFKLTSILAVSCITWGLLSTSFFGVTFTPDSAFRKISPISWLIEKKTAYHFQLQDHVAENWLEKFPSLRGVDDPKEILMTAVGSDGKTGAITYDLFNEFSNDILLELALFIGAIHISSSLIRNLKRNWAGIGWLLFIVGCYLYFPLFLEATSFTHYLLGIDLIKGAEVGLWLIFGGIGLALLLGVIRDKLFGLLEIMNVIQIFGDAMSYLRLYALALSGALVTSALIDLAAGLPVVLGVLLLLVGHVINLGLCVMGGVIHGLRLNFLEWYHYSFEGGGKRFNPLRKINMEK